MDIQAQNIDVEVDYVDEETLRQQQEERMQQFGHSLSKMRDEWVRARYALGVDKRWTEDLDQYNGKDSVNKAASQMMTSVEQGYPVTPRVPSRNAQQSTLASPGRRRMPLRLAWLTSYCRPMIVTGGFSQRRFPS